MIIIEEEEDDQEDDFIIVEDEPQKNEVKTEKIQSDGQKIKMVIEKFYTIVQLVKEQQLLEFDYQLLSQVLDGMDLIDCFELTAKNLIVSVLKPNQEQKDTESDYDSKKEIGGSCIQLDTQPNAIGNFKSHVDSDISDNEQKSPIKSKITKKSDELSQ